MKSPEVLEAIVALAKDTVPHAIEAQTIEGVVRFFDRRSGAEIARRGALLAPVFPNPLRMGTLASLVSYVAANRDSLNLGKLLLNVVVDGLGTEEAQRVELIGPPEGETRSRPVYAVAVHSEEVELATGKYMPPGDMILALQTLFVRDEVLETLLYLMSNVRAETVVTSQDDGIVQEIVVRQSSALNAPAPVKLPNPVPLRLYRTFRELEQPISLFSFRAKNGNPGQLPGFGLFPINDGAWRLEVRVKIREELELLIADANVVRGLGASAQPAPALLDIPIIV